MELSLIIPTYNEASIIIQTSSTLSLALGSTLAVETEVIIIDDGSDDLPTQVQSLTNQKLFKSISVKRNTVPVGKGAALAMGFSQAQAPLVGFIDADLSTPARYILEARAKMKELSCDVLIGSRRLRTSSSEESNQCSLKTILGQILPYLSNALLFQVKHHYKDTQCGFKFFKNSVAKHLFKDLVTHDGMSDIEILLRAHLYNYQVKELAVVCEDTRQSKRPLYRTIFKDLTGMWQLIKTYRIQRFQYPSPVQNSCNK